MSKLTKEELTEIVEQQIHQVEEQYSGPLPHPKHLAQFKEIQSDLPDRILKMAESNLDHRQKIEKKALNRNSVLAFLGWFTPSLISMYTIYNAADLISQDKSIESLVALISGLAVLAGAYMIKRNVK